MTCSILVVGTFFSYPALLSDMQGLHVDANAMEVARGVLAFSSGYFIGDCLDMAINRVYAGNFGVWAHHIVTIFCYTSALHNCLLYPYLIFTLLVELNSIFIHQRKLLLLYFVSVPQMPSFYRTIYKHATTLLLLSFPPTRIVANFYLTYRLFADRGTWVAPAWTWWIATCGMILVDYYNMVLWGQVKKSVTRDNSVKTEERDNKKVKKDKGDWKGQQGSEFLD
ncbi:hypothetical protein SpCBS45565_g03031 [Spizellomyces sp. 'palustris']|nr:hypothetical protein SpCBS45565_g03031 [Spizellomyces sp. 'palustris']